MTEEEKKQGIVSKGSSSFPVYRLEARIKNGKYKKVGNQIFTKEWSEVRFEKTNIGIPVNESAAKHYMLCYRSAKAAQWSFYSLKNSYLVQTRIVKFTIIETTQKRIDGYCSFMNGEYCGKPEPGEVEKWNYESHQHADSTEGK